MVQATFDLSAETVQALERLAVERGASVSEVLSSAVDEFVRTRRLSGDDLERRWAELEARVKVQAEREFSVAEVDSVIQEATNEVWAERRAARRH